MSRDIHGKICNDEIISTFEITGFINKGDTLEENNLFQKRIVTHIFLNSKSKIG